jgi:hypothetical protein
MGVVSTVLHLSADNPLSMPGFPVHVNAMRLVSGRVYIHGDLMRPTQAKNTRKNFLTGDMA